MDCPRGTDGRGVWAPPALLAGTCFGWPRASGVWLADQPQGVAGHVALPTYVDFAGLVGLERDEFVKRRVFPAEGDLGLPFANPSTYRSITTWAEFAKWSASDFVNPSGWAPSPRPEAAVVARNFRGVLQRPLRPARSALPNCRTGRNRVKGASVSWRPQRQRFLKSWLPPKLRTTIAADSTILCSEPSGTSRSVLVLWG